MFVHGELCICLFLEDACPDQDILITDRIRYLLLILRGGIYIRSAT